MAVVDRIVRQRLNDQTGHFEYLIKFANTDLDEENGWYRIEELAGRANLEELFVQFNSNMNVQDLQNNAQDKNIIVQNILELQEDIDIRNSQVEKLNDSLEDIVENELLNFDDDFVFKFLENTN